MKRFNNIRDIKWGIMFWLTMNLCYFWALKVHWAESFPGTFDPLRFFMVSAVILLILALLPRDRGIIILYLTAILFLVIIPLGVIYVAGEISGLYVFSILFVFIGVEIIACNVKIKGIQAGSGNGSGISHLMVACAILFIVLTLALLFLQLGIPRFTALNLMNVYDIRENLTISGKLYNMFQTTATAILPFLLAIALYKKSRKETVLLLFVQFLLFLWLANKTTLISLAVFLFGYYFSKKENSALLFSKAMTIGVLILTILEGLNTGVQSGIMRIISQIFSLFIRRSLFVPAVLKGHFYEFFVGQNNQLAGLFGTIVAPILTRMNINEPYADVTYTQVIGNLYADGANANTGIFGKELAHFGYLGILVAGLCLVFFLLAVKVCESRNGKQFACGISIYIIVSLQDGGAMELITLSPMLLVFFILLTFNLKEYTDRKPVVILETNRTG